MKTCSTCRHWQKTAPQPSPIHTIVEDLCSPVDEDTFEPKQLPFEVRACTVPSQARFERPPIANGFALSDASDYAAVMVTGEAFGCVLHEAGLLGGAPCDA